MQRAWVQDATRRAFWSLVWDVWQAQGIPEIAKLDFGRSRIVRYDDHQMSLNPAPGFFISRSKADMQISRRTKRPYLACCSCSATQMAKVELRACHGITVTVSLPDSEEGWR